MTRAPLPLGRLAAEFVVIVTGVLVALGAQAVYEGRQETEREIDALRAIRADLIRIEQEVGAQADRQFEGLGGVTETYLIVRGEIDPPEDWVADIGLGFAQLRLPLGSIEALISSGDARLISSATLRGDLIAYLREQSGMEIYSSQFDDTYLNRTADFIEEMERILVESGIPTPPDSGGPPLHLLPLERVRSSPEIRGYLTLARLLSAARAGLLRSAADEAGTLRTAIEDEFTARGIDFEPMPEEAAVEPGG